MSILAHLIVEPRGGKRAGGRRRIRLSAGRMHGNGTGMRDIEIHDLSSGGCSFASRDPIVPGAALRLDIPHAGIIDATASWVRDAQVGCAFERPLPPDALAAALANSPVVWGDFGQAPPPLPAAVPQQTLNKARWPVRLAVLSIVAGLAMFWGLMAVLL